MYLLDWMDRRHGHPCTPYVLRMTGRFTQLEKSKPIERSCYFVWNTNNKQVLFVFSYGTLSLFSCFLKGLFFPVYSIHCQ